ncbi:MAG: hypothetical protein PHV28_12250, partial [Kiritimatiellae bacterium]|nr:hypothetical protein [Kiritimatiellia bacterium]
MPFRFKRSEFRLPVAQLNHMEIALSFYETHVDGTAVLTLTAREPLKTLELDARELEILEVALAAVGTPPPGGRLGEPSLPKRAGD